MAIKLKHYVVWYSKDYGMQTKYRASHKAMEALVNKVIKQDDYESGSLIVIVGMEELKPDSGKGLI